MADIGDELERGRDAFAREAWGEAHRRLSAADGSAPLDPVDLEALATAAYLIGRQAEYVGQLERAYEAHLDAGRPLAAVRCAFWVGVTLARSGEAGHAGGWLARARRLLERTAGDHVERGYMLLPVAIQHR